MIYLALLFAVYAGYFLSAIMHTSAAADRCEACQLQRLRERGL